MRSTPLSVGKRHGLQNVSTIRKIFGIVGIFLIVVEVSLLQLALLYETSDPLEDPDQHSKLPKGLQSSSSKQLQTRTPDGTFNGYPVYYHDLNETSSSTYHTKPYSLLHCVGENYQGRYSWRHRSCHYRFLCFDADTKEFSIFARPDDLELASFDKYTDWSQTWMSSLSSTNNNNNNANTTTKVSLGGLNQKWGDEGMERLQWFPTIKNEPPTQFYTLPDSVVMIPFHSFAGWNPGHLVWDDFLPIFNLLTIFQETQQLLQQKADDDNNAIDLLLLRMILMDHPTDNNNTSDHKRKFHNNNIGLWATCEDFTNIQVKHGKGCSKMFRKFGPLMTRQPISSQLDAMLIRNKASTKPSTSLVCAKNGLAGLGPLTDHGVHKLHGWLEEDYRITHNHGRADTIWKFRNFCLQNLGISTTTATSTSTTPWKIVFSEQSSNAGNRCLDFSKHVQGLEETLKRNNSTYTSDISIERVVLKDMKLKEQVELLATQTTIFITAVGGGAVTATFLDRGSTVFMFYNERGGQRQSVQTDLPARLDWDLLNNLAYLNVHWFPVGMMNTTNDIELFVEIVQDDLRRRVAQQQQQNKN